MGVYRLFEVLPTSDQAYPRVYSCIFTLHTYDIGMLGQRGGGAETAKMLKKILKKPISH